MLLEPKKGTQGREMNRKIRIASVSVLIVGLSVVSPSAALANPLLSGYGGPGAGEQALIGSTLLGGPHGGGGSGGSSGTTGSGGSGPSGFGLSLSNGGGPSVTLSGRASGVGGGSRARSATGSTGARGASGSASSGSGTRTGTGSQTFTHSALRAPLYSSAQQSAAGGSSMFAVSGGALLLVGGVVVALALVGTLTLRLSRLQP